MVLNLKTASLNNDMRVEITFTQDNYDESKHPLAISDEKLNAGWVEITFRNETYSVLRADLDNFCRAVLAMKEAP